MLRKGGAPQRLEAVAVADRGQAAEQGIDEDRSAVAVYRDVVDVQIAGGVADLRDIETIVVVLGFALGEQVFETPDLVEAAHPESVGRGAEAHAAVEGAFEDGQFAAALEAQEEEFADLVGGEGERDFLLGQPGQHLTGGGDFQMRRLRGRPVCGLGGVFCLQGGLPGAVL